MLPTSPTSAYARRAVVVVVLAHQSLPLVAHRYAVARVAVLSGANRATTASVAGVGHARLAHRVPVGALARIGAVGSDLRGERTKRGKINFFKKQKNGILVDIQTRRFDRRTRTKTLVDQVGAASELLRQSQFPTPARPIYKRFLL